MSSSIKINVLFDQIKKGNIKNLNEKTIPQLKNKSLSTILTILPGLDENIGYMGWESIKFFASKHNIMICLKNYFGVGPFSSCIEHNNLILFKEYLRYINNEAFDKEKDKLRTLNIFAEYHLQNIYIKGRYNFLRSFLSNNALGRNLVIGFACVELGDTRMLELYLRYGGACSSDLILAAVNFKNLDAIYLLFKYGATVTKEDIEHIFYTYDSTDDSTNELILTALLSNCYECTFDDIKFRCLSDHDYWTKIFNTVKYKIYWNKIRNVIDFHKTKPRFQFKFQDQQSFEREILLDIPSDIFDMVVEPKITFQEVKKCYDLEGEPLTNYALWQIVKLDENYFTIMELHKLSINNQKNPYTRKEIPKYISSLYYDLVDWVHPRYFDPRRFLRISNDSTNNKNRKQISMKTVCSLKLANGLWSKMYYPPPITTILKMDVLAMNNFLLDFMRLIINNDILRDVYNNEDIFRILNCTSISKKLEKIVDFLNRADVISDSMSKTRILIIEDFLKHTSALLPVYQNNNHASLMLPPPIINTASSLQTTPIDTIPPLILDSSITTTTTSSNNLPLLDSSIMDWDHEIQASFDPYYEYSSENIVINNPFTNWSSILPVSLPIPVNSIPPQEDIPDIVQNQSSNMSDQNNLNQ